MTLSAWAPGPDGRIGLGEVSGRVVPSCHERLLVVVLPCQPESEERHVNQGRRIAGAAAAAALLMTGCGSDSDEGDGK